MKEIVPAELKALMDQKADFQLIDVREPHEYEIANIGGQMISLSEIPGSIDKISKEKQVIIHCRSGARSGQAVQWLENNHGFKNLWNLKGGILAWSDQVDPTITKY